MAVASKIPMTFNRPIGSGYFYLDSKGHTIKGTIYEITTDDLIAVFENELPLKHLIASIKIDDQIQFEKVELDIAEKKQNPSGQWGVKLRFTDLSDEQEKQLKAFLNLWKLHQYAVDW